MSERGSALVVAAGENLMQRIFGKKLVWRGFSSLNIEISYKLFSSATVNRSEMIMLWMRGG